MTREKYLNRFNLILTELQEITTAKNSDYASKSDAFANFRVIENLSLGRITTMDGILTRMSDKLSRIINLTGQEAKVTTESIVDTLNDLAVYSIIARIWVECKMDTQSYVDLDDRLKGA